LSKSYDSIELFDIESNQLVKKFNFESDETRITCIKYLPENMIICGTENGLIKILNIETGECIQTIKVHTNIINNIVIISNKTFLTCSQDSTIKYFDLDTFACIRTFNGHSHPVYTINRISIDKFVSTSWDCTIRIWSLNKSNCLNVIQAGSYGKVIVISEKIIISHNKEKFIIWDIDYCRNIGEIKLDNQFVMRFIKLSDNKIVSGFNDGLIKIWNIETFKCIKTIRQTEKSCVWCLEKLSKNLVVIGDEMGIKILDIESGKSIKTLRSETGETECIDLF
jgi:WD40 repeat protein